MNRRSLFSTGLLTLGVFLVHGFHPFADDGAVYIAGVKKLILPGLYPADAIFALAPTRLSIFAPVLAALARLSHLPLEVLLLILHLTSVFLFLLSCLRLAKLIFSSLAQQFGALLMAACCFTLPVAGTSLSIMDPYVTARSFSTPFSLFAVTALLQGKYLSCALWLIATALLHPLMAAYATVFLIGLALARRKRWRVLAGYCLIGLMVAGAVFLLSLHTDLRSAWSQAALSRSYFFLSSWEWYEYLGLVAPLLLLATNFDGGPYKRSLCGGHFAVEQMPGALLPPQNVPHTSFACMAHRQKWSLGAERSKVEELELRRALAIAVVAIGTTALAASICFVHRNGSLWLARLQLLRAFHWVYLVGMLLAGGLLGTLWAAHKRAVAATYLFIAAALFLGQRETYPASRHVEWPGGQPENLYQQAFLWIRNYTPNDTLFALDNDYIEAAGEDAQGFRAIAERSTLADYYKDGGIAANSPQAAALWTAGSAATQGLNRAADAERIARLRPFGVTWVVLPSQAETHLECPYANQGVRVCRLPILLGGMKGAK